MDKLDIEACKKENPFIVLADVIYKHGSVTTNG